MKKQTFTLAALVFGLGITLASCSYKGKCTCDVGGVDVSDEYDFDNKEDYDEARDNCKDLDCTWTDKL